MTKVPSDRTTGFNKPCVLYVTSISEVVFNTTAKSLPAVKPRPASVSSALHSIVLLDSLRGFPLISKRVSCPTIWTAFLRLSEDPLACLTVRSLTPVGCVEILNFVVKVPSSRAVVSPLEISIACVVPKSIYISSFGMNPSPVTIASSPHCTVPPFGSMLVILPKTEKDAVA